MIWMLKNCLIFCSRKAFEQWQTLTVFQREDEGRKSLVPFIWWRESANCNSLGLFVPRISLSITLSNRVGIVWLHGSICFSSLFFICFLRRQQRAWYGPYYKRLVVGTIIDGLCYCSNKDTMLVTYLFILFLFLFFSLRSRNDSFEGGVLPLLDYLGPIRSTL